jgi:hypothetical protein
MSATDTRPPTAPEKPYDVRSAQIDAVGWAEARTAEAPWGATSRAFAHHCAPNAGRMVGKRARHLSYNADTPGAFAHPTEAGR